MLYLGACAGVSPPGCPVCCDNSCEAALAGGGGPTVATIPTGYDLSHGGSWGVINSCDPAWDLHIMAVQVPGISGTLTLGSAFTMLSLCGTVDEIAQSNPCIQGSVDLSGLTVDFTDDTITLGGSSVVVAGTHDFYGDGFVATVWLYVSCRYFNEPAIVKVRLLLTQDCTIGFVESWELGVVKQCACAEYHVQPDPTEYLNVEQRESEYEECLNFQGIYYRFPIPPAQTEPLVLSGSFEVPRCLDSPNPGIIVPLPAPMTGSFSSTLTTTTFNITVPPNSWSSYDGVGVEIARFAPSRCGYPECKLWGPPQNPFTSISVTLGFTFQWGYRDQCGGAGSFRFWTPTWVLGASISGGN